MSSSYYDTYNAHYNYILGLIPYTTTDSVNVATATAATNTNLKNYNDVLKTNIEEQNNVLTQQEDVIRILDREKARLDQKKDSIDTVLAGQMRMNDLNMSYSAKYEAYNSLIKFIVIILIIIFVILALKPFLPGAVVVTLLFFISLYSVFIIYFSIRDIWRRDNLNFNKLDSSQLLSPSVAMKSSGSTASTDYNRLFSDLTTGMNSLGVCVGEQCCVGDMVYDASNNVCTSPSAFTSLETAYQLKEIPITGGTINGAVPDDDKTKLNFGSFKH